MAWFKVDDQLPVHPKWLVTPQAARGLWITAGAWSAAHQRDGHVPSAALPALGAKRREADALVRAGLWTVSDTGDGWNFHDWDKYQPSHVEIIAKREAQAERIRKWRARRDAKKPGRHMSAA